jgi:hypothetical protein
MEPAECADIGYIFEKNQCGQLKKILNFIPKLSASYYHLLICHEMTV